MSRQITWALATEFRNGQYNSSFVFDAIQPALDMLARYWNIHFVRVSNYNSARVKILQSSKALAGGAFAVASKSAMRIAISPSSNYGGLASRCARVIQHEFLHLAGSSNHLPGTLSLMTVNGGSAGNLTEPDYAYMRSYPWRGALRPHHEPNYRNIVFPQPLGLMRTEELPPLVFNCNHRWIDYMFAWSKP